MRDLCPPKLLCYYCTCTRWCVLYYFGSNVNVSIEWEIRIVGVVIVVTHLTVANKQKVFGIVLLILS